MTNQTIFKKTILKKKISTLFIVCLLFAACAFTIQGGLAQSTYTLGNAASFSVLAATTVTNTGATVVTGNVGVSPGTAITGFPPGVVNPPSTIYSAGAEPANAQTDATTAYNFVVAQATTVDLTGQNLGGLTLTPGVYSFSSSADLTGILTLDAQGDPNAFFFFKIGSTLTTASLSDVNYINGQQPCNVVWAVGSSATLGTESTFAGTILAVASITATTGVTVDGRLIARNGAVTLDTNTINNEIGQLPTSVVSEYTVGALAAIGASFAALLFYKRKSLPRLINPF